LNTPAGAIFEIDVTALVQAQRMGRRSELRLAAHRGER
jgi:hypothetical protein